MRNRIALLSKLAEATLEAQNAHNDVLRAQNRLDKARSIKNEIRVQLDNLDVVQVAYLTTPAGRPLTNSLQDRETFDYIDGTEKGLNAGDVVVAPTRYNRYQKGIVVQVGGQRTYPGRLNRITEVLYP